MAIANYKRLVQDQIYIVEDSEGETHRLQYRGYGYSDDWYEDELVFWEPGTRDVIKWPACEFQGATVATDAS